MMQSWRRPPTASWRSWVNLMGGTLQSSLMHTKGDESKACDRRTSNLEFYVSCRQQRPKAGHRPSRREDNVVQVRESNISGIPDRGFVEDDSTYLDEVDRER